MFIGEAATKNGKSLDRIGPIQSVEMIEKIMFPETLNFSCRHPRHKPRG
jgi:hypothetical protein